MLYSGAVKGGRKDRGVEGTGRKGRSGEGRNGEGTSGRGGEGERDSYFGSFIIPEPECLKFLSQLVSHTCRYADGAAAVSVPYNIRFSSDIKLLSVCPSNPERLMVGHQDGSISLLCSGKKLICVTDPSAKILLLPFILHIINPCAGSWSLCSTLLFPVRGRGVYAPHY